MCSSDLQSVTTSETEAFLESLGLNVVDNSVEQFGFVQKFSSADAGEGKTLGSGILLASGRDSIDGAWNTIGLPTQTALGDGTDQIENLLESVLQAAGYSKTDMYRSGDVTNYSAVKFSVVSNSPSLITSFLLLSSEFFNSNWDIAVIAVDGTNYAYLSNGQILRIVPESNLNDLSGENKVITINGNT